MALDLTPASDPATDSLSQAVDATPEVRTSGAELFSGDSFTKKKDPEVKTESQADKSTEDKDTKAKASKKDSKSAKDASSDKDEPAKGKAQDSDKDVPEAKADAEDATDEPTSKDKDTKAKPEEGRIVELSRSKRAAETRAVKAEERATKAEAEIQKLQPVIELLEVATRDPVEFITQLAAATGLTPEKVAQVIATKAAGTEPALAIEDKFAALEKRLADKEAKEALQAKEADDKAKDAQYSSARAKNVTSTLEFITQNSEEYPALAADGEEGAEAVYEVVEARWAALREQGRAPTNPASMQILYKKAAQRVNQLLVEQTERRAAKLGYKKAQQKVLDKDSTAADAAPKSFKGLSSEQAGANSPPNDPKRVWSDDEVLAAGNRIFGVA